MYTYSVECGVVDFAGEVECCADVVVCVGLAEVGGFVGLLVVVLKVLLHSSCQFPHYLHSSNCKPTLENLQCKAKPWFLDFNFKIYFQDSAWKLVKRLI